LFSPHQNNQHIKNLLELLNKRHKSVTTKKRHFTINLRCHCDDYFVLDGLKPLYFFFFCPDPVSNQFFTLWLTALKERQKKVLSWKYSLSLDGNTFVSVFPIISVNVFRRLLKFC